MCVAISPVSDIVMGIVSAVATTAVNIKQASNTSAVQKFQAEQNIKQAKIAERNAVYERQEGIEEAREKRLQAIKNIGSQKTMIASGNIMASSSTALNLFDDEKLSGEIDALKLIDSSEKKAQSYIDSAKNLYANASIKKYQSSNTLGNAISNQLIKFSPKMYEFGKDIERLK